MVGFKTKGFGRGVFGQGVFVKSAIVSGVLTIALISGVGASVVGIKVKTSDGAKLASWVALNAPTGHEHFATGPLMERLKGWRIDRTGNMLKTTGSSGGSGAGDHHRVVACQFDAHSFAVSQITDKGYLRLHTIGRGSGHKLWSQSHEGQQVRILTRQGPLVGVTAASNGHFVNLHRHETALVRADDLWVDVGATNAKDVAAMGINLLDPVVRNIPAWHYAGEVAGPNAGARVGCAAVVAAAEAGVSGASASASTSTGRTTWVLSTQNNFNGIGLSSAIGDLAGAGQKVDEVILVGKGEDKRRNEPVTSINRRTDPVLKYAGVNKIHRLAPKVSDAGALMERITLSEANNLLTTLVTMVDGKASEPVWITAPNVSAVVNGDPKRLAGGKRGKSLTNIEALLDPLAETSATPGHEGPVRAIVLSAMPKWAKEIAQSDDMGNVWVDMGPKDGKATVFMAHMDEVGYEVKSIDADGVVRLTRKGGAIGPLWEGQPALMQLDAAKGAQSSSTVENLKGVFLTRGDAKVKNPADVSAWFGMDAAGLEKAGVKIGMGVTGYKEGHRMGPYRYSARGLDDRVGTTALLKALNEIDVDKLNHRVIFVWSVQEEGGLNGAQAMANRFGKDSQRIYSVDTFVSSDTPLESPHFAYAPLGSGPVLRSIENSGMVRPHDLDRNRGIAKDAGIKVQIGQTQGGTDGTTFAYWGAPNAGLSWPGRYSHGPAEIADLRDVADLVKLIKAFAMAKPD